MYEVLTWCDIRISRNNCRNQNCCFPSRSKQFVNLRHFLNEHVKDKASAKYGDWHKEEDGKYVRNVILSKVLKILKN